MTIILKFTDGINLAAQPHHEIGDQIILAAALTSSQRSDTYLRVRDVQNVIAVDAYRSTAERKLLQLQHVTLAGAAHPVRSYLAASQANTRGIVHGIRAHVSEEEIRQKLEVQGAKLLNARRLGSSNSILVTVEGTRLPRYAMYSRVVMRLHPYRPHSPQCAAHCYAIGHQTDVSPNKTTSVTCPTCSTDLPIETGLATPHTCEPYCRNCQGEHPLGTPTFPAMTEAD